MELLRGFVNEVPRRCHCRVAIGLRRKGNRRTVLLVVNLELLSDELKPELLVRHRHQTIKTAVAPSLVLAEHLDGALCKVKATNKLRAKCRLDGPRVARSHLRIVIPLRFIPGLHRWLQLGSLNGGIETRAA